MSTALYLWNLEIIHDVHHSGGLATMYSRPFKDVKDNWTVLGFLLALVRTIFKFRGLNFRVTYYAIFHLFCIFGFRACGQVG